MLLEDANQIVSSLNAILQNCAKETWPSQAQSDLHVKSKHPQTISGCAHTVLWGMTNMKENMNKICKTWHKGFMYQSHLKAHQRVYIKKGLIPCTGYDRKFTSNTAMRAHSITHQNIKFKCSTCSKEFDSPAYLKQHEHGMHGEGFLALCGLAYVWLKQKVSHEQDCDDCRDIYFKKLEEQEQI